jgi:tetratricopeptide (TPR) repeat protein
MDTFSAVILASMLVGVPVALAFGILYLNDQRKRRLTARALIAGKRPKASWDTNKPFIDLSGYPLVLFVFLVSGVVYLVVYLSLERQGVTDVQLRAGTFSMLVASFVTVVLYFFVVVCFYIRNVDPAISRAERLTKNGNPDEALASLRRAVDEKPTANRWNAIGCELLANERWNDALSAFREAERIEGQKPIVLGNMGFALWKMGRLEEGLTLVEEARRQKPAILLFAINRCLILADLGRGGDANEELERVEQLYRQMPRRIADRSGASDAVKECRERLKVAKPAVDRDLLS